MGLTDVKAAASWRFSRPKSDGKIRFPCSQGREEKEGRKGGKEGCHVVFVVIDIQLGRIPQRNRRAMAL